MVPWRRSLGGFGAVVNEGGHQVDVDFALITNKHQGAMDVTSQSFYESASIIPPKWTPKNERRRDGDD